jgi:two-component system cell cycle sensor histidine kinase/response regulator CckA
MAEQRGVRAVVLSEIVNDAAELSPDAEAVVSQKEAERRIHNRMRTLIELTNDLRRAATVDELCRQAVARGRTELGFDRLSIWFFEGENRLRGTWGTDEQGELRDERDSRIPVDSVPMMIRVLEGPERYAQETEGAIYDHYSNVVGIGVHALAALWDGANIIGFLSADNLLQKREWTEFDAELLTLYASVLGHLSNRLRMEESLRASEARFRVLADSSPVMIFMTGADLGCTFVNRKWAEFTGLVETEALGFGWCNPIHPDDRQAAREACEMALRAHGSCQAEYRMRRHDGQYRHILAFGAAHFADDGAYLGIIGSCVDITEQKAMQTQLAETNRLESLGRLAGGIAHDFNNLLTAILGYAELVQEALAPDTEEFAMLTNACTAAMRAAELTRQLLMYARRQVVRYASVDMNQLILDMEPLLGRTIGANYELTLQLSSLPCYAHANAAQIEQVLMNLVINARDALKDEGRILIETAPLTLDADYAARHVGALPGEYVMLAVSDNGVGIPPEVQQRIFEPFFTTKPVGAGTGLGLATCYGIVKQSRGNIWVYSEPERGTTFKVYLPRIGEMESSATDGAAPSADDLARGTETVLLVDDDPMVRDITSRILRSHGYRVLEASNGAEALHLQGSWDGKIDLLVTDVVMPLMGGPELAERVRKRRPSLKTLYISGYTQAVTIKEGELTPDVCLLTKPFSAADLIARVQEVLGVRC